MEETNPMTFKSVISFMLSPPTLNLKFYHPNPNPHHYPNVIMAIFMKSFSSLSSGISEGSPTDVPTPPTPSILFARSKTDDVALSILNMLSILNIQPLQRSSYNQQYTDVPSPPTLLIHFVRTKTSYFAKFLNLLF